MSSSSTLAGRAGRAAALGLALALSACQAAPLYGTTSIDPATGASNAALAQLRGRIAIVEAQARTDQILRNALLFQLNGAEPVRDPIYQVTLAVSGSDSAVSIQGGSGTPRASVYRMSATYTVTRIADGQVVTRGSRFATAPYDRSDQLFAAQRALLNARQNAGETLAAQITLAIAPVLRGDVVGQPSAAALPRT